MIRLISISIGLLCLSGLLLLSELGRYRSAFLYAYGPYEFARAMQDLSAQRESQGGLLTADMLRQAYPDLTGRIIVNRHVHSTELADYRFRSVTTPNNDTLYTSAVLDLSVTPVELRLPETVDRYVSVALMDAFTDQFAHIGPRETRGKEQIYWIQGPGDPLPAPAGVSIIRATGNDVWLLARVFVSGLDDLSAARAMQQGIVVQPVFPDRAIKPFRHKVTEVSDAENFLNVVNEILARNPEHPQAQRAGLFPQLDISKASDPGPVRRFIWSQLTGRAEAAITRQIDKIVSSGKGWTTPPETIGNYGEDDLTRAAIALIGFGALRRSDAIYFRMMRTEQGDRLDGSKSYQMILPANVPAEAFWSMALYQPDGSGRFFFYETATGRHSLNAGSSGLIVNQAGHIVLHIGPEPPQEPGMNWMPTPDGHFAAFFRLYLPKPEALNAGWTPPPLTEK